MDSIENRQHHSVTPPLHYTTKLSPESYHHTRQAANIETNSCEIDTMLSVDIGERHVSVSEQLVPP